MAGYGESAGRVVDSIKIETPGHRALTSLHGNSCNATLRIASRIESAESLSVPSQRFHPLLVALSQTSHLLQLIQAQYRYLQVHDSLARSQVHTLHPYKQTPLSAPRASVMTAYSHPRRLKASSLGILWTCILAWVRQGRQPHALLAACRVWYAFHTTSLQSGDWPAGSPQLQM